MAFELGFRGGKVTSGVIEKDDERDRARRQGETPDSSQREWHALATEGVTGIVSLVNAGALNK